MSSSADWTTTIWSKNFSDSPILTLENSEDYVYQSKFHPNNPSLLATVDGIGKFDMWDINYSYESPLYSTQLSNNALTKLAFSEDGGKRVSIGDANGKISLYNMHKDVRLFLFLDNKHNSR